MTTQQQLPLVEVVTQPERCWTAHCTGTALHLAHNAGAMLWVCPRCAQELRRQGWEVE